MKRTVVSLIAIAGLSLPAFGQADAQKPALKPPAPAQPTAPAKPATPAAQPDATQEAWMKSSMPGDHHKTLNAFVGTFTAKCKFWMGGPEAPATESTGTMTGRWVLGNRFVRSEFKGEFMETPFEGIGYLGFDNLEQKFIGSWIDSMSTGMMTSSGAYDAAKKTFTMTGKFKDPTGQSVTSREVTTIIDANSHKFEMYHAGADGKEHKVGEITYTRSGAAVPATPARPAAPTADKPGSPK